MNFKPKRKLSLVLVLMFTLSLILACNIEERRSTLPVEYDTYIIDTSSILMSIIQGKEDVFMPVTSSASEEITSEFPVNWKQADYLVIADALHQVAWGSSLDGWKLNSMDFGLLCDKKTHGLQYAHFVFYDTQDTEDGGTRIVHNIVIDPERSSVNVWALRYSPVVINWKTIDLTTAAITADDALQIAESNGGTETRNKVGDDCYISVSFFFDSASYDGWTVSYYQNPGTLLEINIDPITGDIP